MIQNKKALTLGLEFFIIIITIVFVLLIGVMIYRTLNQTSSEAQYVDMVNKIKVASDSLLYQSYGTTEQVNIIYLKNTEKICFVDYAGTNIGANPEDQDVQDIANRIDTSELEEKPNVIILNSKDNKYKTFYAGAITVEDPENLYCMVVEDNINLELTNVGKKILVRKK